MRKGFSLLTAILFLVLVATLGALALSYSTLSAKRVPDTYLRSQAELLLQSSTEYALLAISGHEVNATNDCLENINATFSRDGSTNLFDINISILYFYEGTAVSCPTLNGSTTGNIITPESNRTVIIDTIVSSNPTLTTEPIRLHRRTIQKP